MENVITLQQEEARIVMRCREALNTVVYSKFGCSAILYGINATSWDSNAAKKAKISAEEKYSINLSKGLKVSVWKDDLTTHVVDAVVNAANEDLDHIGGLAFALAEAGGQVIQQESNHIIKIQRKVPTGEAVVTRAGSLPCKWLIHAVGPKLNWRPSEKEIQDASKPLGRAIDSILKQAEQLDLQSVAIPALSSGIFNFPVDRCANIIVNRLQAYDASGFRRNKLSEIRLVNHDDSTVDHMVRACSEILGPGKSYAGAVRASGGGSINSGKSSHKSPVKLRNVTLRIMKGYIERQTASVIVNTTGPELELSKGAVSNAILKVAGRGLQNEIEKYRYNRNFGDVVKTQGYNLKSRFVYHVLCAENRPGTKAGQILSDVVAKCLRMAEYDGCDSISFPAIGSGVLGFSKKEVAQIMTRAVKEFSSHFRGHSMDVNFVIYPLEEDTFQAFVSEFESLQHSNPYAINLNSDHSESSAHNKSKDPYIELRSSFHESQHAARIWIDDLLNIQRKASPVHNIQNNHILHFGQSEHKKLLDLQTKFELGITVSFTDGHAKITIMGSPSGVTAAVLEVEAMCCMVQEAHALEEEASMLYSLVRWRCKDCPQLENPEINAALEKAYLTGSGNVTIDDDTRVNVTLKEVTTKYPEVKYTIDRMCFFKHYNVRPGLAGKSYFNRKLHEHKRGHSEFQKAGLQVVRVEIVENYALQQLFELTKKRITGKPKHLYQRVPAQCCHLVSWVGFQRDYAPPDVQAYGEGIYFTGSVESAMKLWKGVGEEEYVYIIEAEVLTGYDVIGSPGLIVPPQKGSDPLIRYDSLKGGKDTFVVFNGHQALPQHIYTCKRGF